MSTLRTLFLALGLVGLPLAASPQLARGAASTPGVEKLAMVDLQRVLGETKHGKRSKRKLELELKAKQQELDKTRAQLEAEVAKLQRLSGAALQKGQQRLQQESVQWQQEAMKFEADLSQQEAAMLDEIYGNVAAIVKKIAKEQAIDLVLVRDQMTVLYVESSLDITPEVIKRYEKVHK